MSSASELHLIVPGVCGPLAETESLASRLSVKNWISVLSRAHCEDSYSTTTDVITSLFKITANGDFPSAALTMLALDKYDDSSCYMFADPVHLQVDLDHAVLTSSEDLAISEQEAGLLCDMLNQHFNQDGFHFIKINKDHWVISSREPFNLKNTALVDAVGRNINFILPQGGGSAYWKQKLTEAQMLMHTHEINDSRESSGRQTINSLWFHGSGKLPDFERSTIESVCSDDVCIKGLAKHVGCNYLPLFESAADYLNYLSSSRVGDSNAASRIIDVLHLTDLEHLLNYSDVSLWSEKLEEIVSAWIYPLLKFSHKNNTKVILYPCNGKQYQFSQFDAYKFWRQKNLSQHISRY